MNLNPMEALKMFISNAQKQHGPDFDPSQTAKNLLGQDCQTPAEALQLMLRSGRINQQQYDMFVKML